MCFVFPYKLTDKLMWSIYLKNNLKYFEIYQMLRTIVIHTHTHTHTHNKRFFLNHTFFKEKRTEKFQPSFTLILKLME